MPGCIEDDDPNRTVVEQRPDAFGGLFTVGDCVTEQCGEFVCLAQAGVSVRQWIRSDPFGGVAYCALKRIDDCAGGDQSQYNSADQQQDADDGGTMERLT